jgi:hypothetical protein
MRKQDINKALQNVEALLREDQSASPQMRAMMQLLVTIIHQGGAAAYDRIGHPGRLTNIAVSKASLPRQVFKLAERDKYMSEEQKKSSSFMQQLDAWIDGNVIFPLMQTEPELGRGKRRLSGSKKASAKRSCRVTRTGG